MTRQSILMGALIDNLILLEGWEDHATFRPPEIVDVTRLSEDIVSSFRDTNESRVIELRSSATAYARVDPRELTYAIMNLLDNALKYTPGDIDVRIDVLAESIQIIIDDRGPGMERSLAERAFDRFYRGERRDVEGSGLGLAIAKKAIERAAGTISMVSAPSRGTTFTIVLPRAFPGRGEAE
jgi:two-component system sensor histidine kinase SenX3